MCRNQFSLIYTYFLYYLSSLKSVLWNIYIKKHTTCTHLVACYDVIWSSVPSTIVTALNTARNPSSHGAYIECGKQEVNNNQGKCIESDDIKCNGGKKICVQKVYKMQWNRGWVLDRVVREGLMKKATFEQKLNGVKGGSCVDI